MVVQSKWIPALNLHALKPMKSQILVRSGFRLKFQWYPLVCILFNRDPATLIHHQTDTKGGPFRVSLDLDRPFGASTLLYFYVQLVLLHYSLGRSTYLDYHTKQGPCISPSSLSSLSVPESSRKLGIVLLIHWFLDTMLAYNLKHFGLFSIPSLQLLQDHSGFYVVLQDESRTSPKFPLGPRLCIRQAVSTISIPQVGHPSNCSDGQRCSQGPCCS
jgi:hypothetical protein